MPQRDDSKYLTRQIAALDLRISALRKLRMHHVEARTEIQRATRRPIGRPKGSKNKTTQARKK